jgi:protein-arginine kinase activator protein McsA
MTCEKCSNPVEGTYGSGRFCSSSCARSFSSLSNREEKNRKISNKLRSKSRKDRRCRACGKIYEPPPKYTRRRCPDCPVGSSRLGKVFESLRGDRSRRQHLIRERGHSCEVCQLVEWMGRQIPIELDHIDGNPQNNSKENLRLICPNCHAQTPTYKGANVGRHSDTRRQQVMRRYLSYRGPRNE